MIESFYVACRISSCVVLSYPTAQGSLCVRLRSAAPASTMSAFRVTTYAY
jgi:hypothetical protein